MNDPLFARNVLYEVLKLYGWSNEQITEEFVINEQNPHVLCTEEPDEITHCLDFLKKKGIDDRPFFNIYNHKKTTKVLREQLKDGEDKVLIEHPKTGRSISEFSYEIATILQDTEKIFFRPDSKEIVEVRTIKPTQEKEHTYEGFSIVKPNRFITLIEQFIVPYIYLKNQKTNEWERKIKSIGSEIANITLNSEILEKALPHIQRIFGVPLPIIYKEQLTFPEKGYDERFNSWLPENAPEIENSNMNLDEAKYILNTMFSEFCFKDKQDYANAISALITPFLRGLFSQFNTRTPIFFYIANRERAGKDYLAGITGILYEGNNLEEPPISTNENNKVSNSDELRKKILSAMISGRKRLHFQNNKGYINNPILEALATATTWSDRSLGKNEILMFDNELDISLSGNVGIGFTPDLNNRCRKINLFLDIEDANARKFNNPDLHGWVKNNRGKILSALYCLIRNWIINGSVASQIPFTSYPEWARICGGILESAGFESPCNPDKDTLGLSSDPETADMKTLFELCFAKYPHRWIKKSDIIGIIMDSENDVFNNLDFSSRADQTRFALKLTKFIGRYMSSILLKVNNINQRGTRQEFQFTKGNQETLFTHGNVGNLGNVLLTGFSEMKNDISNRSSELVANVAEVTMPIYKENTDENTFNIENNSKPKIFRKVEEVLACCSVCLEIRNLTNIDETGGMVCDECIAAEVKISH